MKCYTRLFLTQDGQNATTEDDPRGRTLLCPEGGDIDVEQARRLGLADENGHQIGLATKAPEGQPHSTKDKELFNSKPAMDFAQAQPAEVPMFDENAPSMASGEHVLGWLEKVPEEVFEKAAESRGFTVVKQGEGKDAATPVDNPVTGDQVLDWLKKTDESALDETLPQFLAELTDEVLAEELESRGYKVQDSGSTGAPDSAAPVGSTEVAATEDTAGAPDSAAPKEEGENVQPNESGIPDQPETKGQEADSSGTVQVEDAKSAQAPPQAKAQAAPPKNKAVSGPDNTKATSER